MLPHTTHAAHQSHPTSRLREEAERREQEGSVKLAMLKEKLAIEASRREEAQREFARVEQETKDQIMAMAAERQRVEAEAMAQRVALEQEQLALKMKMEEETRQKEAELSKGMAAERQAAELSKQFVERQAAERIEALEAEKAKLFREKDEAAQQAEADALAYQEMLKANLDQDR